ncbi:MAG: hypothetical protein QW244_01445 [Candidatus Pacearchaeota archaeon]
MQRKTAETIVLIIGILGIIGSIVMFILSIFGLTGSAILSKIFMPNIGGTILAGVVFLISIISLIVSVVGFVVSIALIKHKNWARITVIVLSVLGVLSSLPSIIYGFGIIFLAIYIAIIYFLGFNKDVVALFR